MEGLLFFFFPSSFLHHTALYSCKGRQGSAKLCVTGRRVSFSSMILLWDFLFRVGRETHDSIQNFLASTRLVSGPMNLE